MQDIQKKIWIGLSAVLLLLMSGFFFLSNSKQHAASQKSIQRALASQPTKSSQWQEVSFLDNPKIFRLRKAPKNSEESKSSKDSEESKVSEDSTKQRRQLWIASVQTLFEKTNIEKIPEDYKSFQELKYLKNQFFAQTLIKDWNANQYLFKKDKTYALLFMKGSYTTDQKEFFVEWHLYHADLTIQILFNNEVDLQEESYLDTIRLLKKVLGDLKELPKPTKNSIITNALSFKGKIHYTSSDNNLGE